MQTSYRILLFAFCLLPFAIMAQRLEVHANKDLSTNETVNKGWGIGAAVDFDHWVKNVIFRANFNWATIYKPTDDIFHHNYHRFSGGVSALYSYKIKEKISIQGGVELNYTYLKHSYIHGYEPIPSDTTKAKSLTVLHTGNFIGIAPHIGVRYELGKRLSAVLNFVPTYLIPVGSKSSSIIVAPEYKKGIWLFPIQLGFSYQIYK